MSEDNEPDWLAELARGSEALRRQMESVVRAAEQFAAGGPARPLARRITRAVDAGMRELLSAPERPVVHQATAALSGVGTLTAVATVTGSGGIALAPFRASGQLTVENPPSGQAERSIGQILAVMLTAVAASGLLGVQGPDQATVGYYLTVIGVLLPIAWFFWNMHK